MTKSYDVRAIFTPNTPMRGGYHPPDSKPFERFHLHDESERIIGIQCNKHGTYLFIAKEVD